jgi:hypothetical protein
MFGVRWKEEITIFHIRVNQASLPGFRWQTALNIVYSFELRLVALHGRDDTG